MAASRGLADTSAAVRTCISAEVCSSLRFDHLAQGTGQFVSVLDGWHQPSAGIRAYLVKEGTLYRMRF